MNTLAVIVPCLNEADLIPGLASMLQDLDADEVICVDGGSQDGTPEMLEQHGLSFLNSGRGRAVQMNAGAAACSADILVFVHADTVLGREHLGDIRQALQDEDVVGGRFDVRLSGTHPALRMIEWLINSRSRLTKISTGDQVMFVRRDVFVHLGGFPEQPLMEDIEFSRLLKKQGKIACLRRTVTTSSRRWEKDGIMRTIALMWWLRLLYYLGVSSSWLASRYRNVR
ncbi:MAG: glycosyltransferase [Zetaproteobacteria bacterium]|nr:MAG: glycosyltransferase [Zetaproteobacteria bacterium]